MYPGLRPVVSAGPDAAGSEVIGSVTAGSAVIGSDVVNSVVVGGAVDSISVSSKTPKSPEALLVPPAWSALQPLTLKKSINKTKTWMHFFIPVTCIIEIIPNSKLTDEFQFF